MQLSAARRTDSVGDAAFVAAAAFAAAAVVGVDVGVVGGKNRSDLGQPRSDIARRVSPDSVDAAAAADADDAARLGLSTKGRNDADAAQHSIADSAHIAAARIAVAAVAVHSSNAARADCQRSAGEQSETVAAESRS